MIGLEFDPILLDRVSAHLAPPMSRMDGCGAKLLIDPVIDSNGLTRTQSVKAICRVPRNG